MADSAVEGSAADQVLAPLLSCEEMGNRINAPQVIMFEMTKKQTKEKNVSLNTLLSSVPSPSLSPSCPSSTPSNLP